MKHRAKSRAKAARFLLPKHEDTVDLDVEGKRVRLTHLTKVFFPERGLTKADLLQYYADIAPVLLPHIRGRAMVMKRYPHGATGEFFFMKRTPNPHPEWLNTCPMEHGSKGVIDFPLIDDLPSLLWVINLGCIDLNPWYARCDDPDRPDYLHFDLDPFEGATFDAVLETARILKRALDALKLKSYAKTTGSKGIHLYIPIKRGPLQKEVWTFSKALATLLASQHPEIITAEYRIKNRPKERVLVDYNQNAWGRTLASVYSVRPVPMATVSAPVTWDEIDRGIALSDFCIENMNARIDAVGDLFAPLLSSRGRADLSRFPISS
jgi:bifunctional non-homologous end joining protein LigD